MIVMMSFRPTAVVTASAALALTSLMACGSDDAGAAPRGKVSVVASFYPFAYVAEQVGGDAVTVENLTKPGAEPHDLELTPKQVGAISQADFAIYLKGFQPSVDEAIEQNKPRRVLEVSSVMPLDQAAPVGGEADEAGGSLAGDPHIWLDPTRLAKVATAVGEQLAATQPSHADEFRARARDLTNRLNALDAELKAGLQNCRQHEFVTSHAAFGYFARRYGLVQIAIAGLSPEQEPTPARIQEIQREVETYGITTVFFETLVSPDLAETIARDTGATTAVLDPIEGVKDPARDDYFSVMRANLEALRKALGPC
jgi:zinc transport system substrate-binding protein